jgi:hypothetical protein
VASFCVCCDSPCLLLGMGLNCAISGFFLKNKKVRDSASGTRTEVPKRGFVPQVRVANLNMVLRPVLGCGN